MGEKSYLKEQVYLPGLSSYDLFTEDELNAYMEIVEAKNELDRMMTEKSENPEKQKWITQKRQAKDRLSALIAQHKGPREVRLENVIYYPKDADYPFPAGVDVKNMKFSKKIAEFSSELTRAMGLKHMDFTFDQIIVNWKSIDVLEQMVLEGITMRLLNPDGTTTDKHYRFYTASAGQLRRDKIQMISVDMWEKIHERIECGLTWDVINQKSGSNCTKFLAYTALPGSATEEWTDFDIDRCIVVPEFKGKVTAEMMYIKPDYTYKNEVCTVEIDHTDGCGMMLPSVSESNFMVRGPYHKGLLCVFDFIQFCKEHNVPAVIKDIYGLEHDLIKEDIRIIFTESMFKMYKFFDSWQQFKDVFKKCGAKFGRTNYEEDEIDNTTLCYQMLQTLQDFTDEEVLEFTKHTHTKIMNVTKNKKSMLDTLKAKTDSLNPYKAALAYYPEMLWEGYTRTQLKDTRKRMLLDAKSGKILMKNKRLFAIPDLYAACEFWFCGIEEPKGLLQGDEIAAKPFINYDKADVLRSPHLYCEHFIAPITHDPNIYKWFTTNGAYTSCHSMVSRVLQFDRRSN